MFGQEMFYRRVANMHSLFRITSYNVCYTKLLRSKVLGLVGYAWAGFGSAFGPVVLLSVLWSRMTRNGALAGMLVGAITVIVWRNGAWFGLYEMVPGFILATVAIVVFSLLDKAPSLQIQQEFEQMQREMETAGESLSSPVAD